MGTRLEERLAEADAHVPRPDPTPAEIYARVEPTPGRVLVEPLEEEETMRGGLHIPATAQEKPVQGTIRALGPAPDEGKDPAALARHSQLAVGQRVLYGKYSGTEIVVEGLDLLILSELDILSILHPRPEENQQSS